MYINSPVFRPIFLQPYRLQYLFWLYPGRCHGLLHFQSFGLRKRPCSPVRREIPVNLDLSFLRCGIVRPCFCRRIRIGIKLSNTLIFKRLYSIICFLDKNLLTHCFTTSFIFQHHFGNVFFHLFEKLF